MGLFHIHIFISAYPSNIFILIEVRLLVAVSRSVLRTRNSPFPLTTARDNLSNSQHQNLHCQFRQSLVSKVKFAEKMLFSPAHEATFKELIFRMLQYLPPRSTPILRNCTVFRGRAGYEAEGDQEMFYHNSLITYW